MVPRNTNITSVEYRIESVGTSQYRVFDLSYTPNVCFPPIPWQPRVVDAWHPRVVDAGWRRTKDSMLEQTSKSHR